MRTPSRPGLAALALVTALGLSACGDNDADTGADIGEIETGDSGPETDPDTGTNPGTGDAGESDLGDVEDNVEVEDGAETEVDPGDITVE